jgi:hypothetical protein
MAPWDQLIAAGLPDGPAGLRVALGSDMAGSTGPIPTLDNAAIRTAILAVIQTWATLPLRERELFVAWFAALAQHWPTKAQQIAGSEFTRIHELVLNEVVDDNRYLKLRRIAIERIAALGFA